jgi:Fe-S cluster assembly protein SufD
VKCTHGATIGQIEDQALFYLRTRGIDELSARQLLLLAFANECTDRMKQGAARTLVQNLIQNHLSQMARIQTTTRERGPDEHGVERNWGELQ